MAFLGARVSPGIETVLELTDLKTYVKKADLVITGEGKLDRQTVYGKAPLGVARLARRYGRPVIGISGTLGPGNELLYQHGFSSIFSIMEKPTTPAQAMKEVEVLLANTAERIMRIIYVQTKIQI
jgi:glycerate kinase